MEKKNLQADQPDKGGKPALKRRTLLKALAGIPVLGAFAFELSGKRSYDLEKKNRILKDLELDKISIPSLQPLSGGKGDILRIGLIGFGNRAVSHANGLGYMHPEDAENRKLDGTLEDWLLQEDLNVAITGICDVFDLHAERGLETARNTIRAGGARPVDLPVKRYRTYQEMLDDKEIDAVMIATPDHQSRSYFRCCRQGRKTCLL